MPPRAIALHVNAHTVLRHRSASPFCVTVLCHCSVSHCASLSMSPGTQSQDTSSYKQLGWHVEFESRVTHRCQADGLRRDRHAGGHPCSVRHIRRDGQVHGPGAARRQGVLLCRGCLGSWDLSGGIRHWHPSVRRCAWGRNQEHISQMDSHPHAAPCRCHVTAPHCACRTK